MKTALKLNRKDFIAQLKALKEDNIQIADVAINRRKLLAALTLQVDDQVTITYGKVSFQDTFSDREVKVDSEPCVQFSSNGTAMRFLNRPKTRDYCVEPVATPLNFVDYREATAKTELTGTPLDTPALIDALTFVAHGVATEHGRPALECVLFDCGADSISLVAADGYRLAVARINALGITANRALMHRQDFPRLLLFLKSNFTGKGKSKAWLPVYLDISEGKVKFSSDKSTVELADQSGPYPYPDYEQLIPKDGTHIQLLADQMLQAVKALIPIARDGSGIIRLQFSYPDHITLSARSEEYGDTAVQCPAKVEQDCYIAMNGKYLTDLLSLCKDNLIDLYITSPASPMLCRCGADRLEVIMPMFVQW